MSLFSLKAAEESGPGELRNAIRSTKRPIAFLLGSALTAPHRGLPGVPGTTGMVELFLEAARRHGWGEEVRDNLLQADGDAAQYQACLEAVNRNGGQDLIREIVKAAVANALSDNFSIDEVSGWGEPVQWSISPSLRVLARLHRERQDCFPGPILTTNFDTLVETALTEAECNFVTVAADRDFDLTPLDSNENLIQIVHLHGCWQGDTLHTPEQLSAPRQELQDNLITIAESHTIVVLGYSGWDDVFTSAMLLAAKKSTVKPDVLWAFYESDGEELVRRYSHLFRSKDDSPRSWRFRPYAGVDLHELFDVMESDFLTSQPRQGLTELSADVEEKRLDDYHLGGAEIKLDQPEPKVASNSPTLKDLWKAGLSNEAAELSADATNALIVLSQSAPNLMECTLTSLQSILYLGYENKVEIQDRAFHSRRHVLISAPTSSGKSTVAEIFLARPPLLNHRKRVSVYVAPTRALAQAKFREFQESFDLLPGIRDGLILSTGEDNADDWRLNHGIFSIACMVYEKASILFSRNQNLLSKIGCLVIDEGFMLDELSRGPALEVALAKALMRRIADDSREDLVGQESLRVVVLSTESEIATGLVDLLATRDSGNQRDLEPLVFRDVTRPVAVEHSLLLPGLPEGDGGDERSGYTVFPFVTFAGDDSRQLSRAELTKIDTELHEISGSLNEVRNRNPKATLAEHPDRIVRFCLDRLRQWPTGYRALVFVPSKFEVEKLAGTVYNQREKIDASDDAIERLRAVARRGEDRQLSQKIVRYSGRRVFFHHSDVERPVRQEIEAIAGRISPSAPSEIIFSTTTLSYGVNLAVAEVILVGTTFYTQTRQGDVIRGSLSTADFHNMTGRVGRLGKEGAVSPKVYISLPLDLPRPFSVIELYYSQEQPLRSRLFVRDDSPRRADRSRQQEFQKALGSLFPEHETEAPVDIAQFSHPFVQAVLDALRHLNNRGGGRQQGAALHGAPDGQDLESFMANTLLFYQARSEEGRVDDFWNSVKQVLEGCSRSPLDLVQKVGGTNPMFRITDAGEAVIDTSTEIQTVQRLAGAASAVRGAWSEVFEGEQFPSDLYLLPLVMQEEVYRLAIDSTPEGRGGSRGHKWESDLEKKNQATVVKIFNEALASCGVAKHVDKFGDILREAIVGVDSVRQIATPYPGGGVDAICRLFASSVSWISGNSVIRCRKIAEKVAPQASQDNNLDGSRLNFRQLFERLRYKAIFLGKLLAAGTSELRAGVAEQRSLFLLAERLRLGAKADAVPLFYPRASNLSREEAHSLVDDGWIPARILLLPTTELSDIPLREEDRRVRLQRDLEEFSRKQFQELAAQMTEGVQVESGPEQAVATLWKVLSGLKQSSTHYLGSISAYRSEAPLASGFGSILLKTLDPTQWSDEHECRYGLTGSVLGSNLFAKPRSASSRIWSGVPESGRGPVTWLFEHPVDEYHRESEDELGEISEDELGEGAEDVYFRPLKRGEFRIYGVDFGPDWTVQRDGSKEPIYNFLNEVGSRGAAVVVGWPWIPPKSKLARADSEGLDRLWDRGNRFLFVTPVAFFVLLSFLLRDFTSEESVQRLLIASQDRGWRQVLTVNDVIEALVDSSPDVPRAIREALLKYIEIADVADSSLI